ncbi:hypothetical protein I4641_11935 [Waterburya agarophytonicola K14]|uniref:Calcium-binding protein n=1 Tax=Waterburya agarophytonicola KI4 TaxID=2874699 RepID=A0A964FHJ7_9CYAN|nr:calcium-binding protein [Waterburya agarophytonicola]MCC0177689.1 hypothetical protein [Waterburya agarophytonicola KI4]
MAENQIFGTENNDLLLDTALEDEIFAFGGNDEIETTEGSDIIYGDTGRDTLTFNYGDHNGDLNINLSSYDSSTGDGSVYVESYSPNYFTNNINFYSIEKLKLLGGDGNDTLGSYSNNGIVSDETIEGGAGDDYISTGKGYDVVDGGTGFDILNLDFSSNYSGVTSSLNDSNSGEYTSDESVVEFSNIEGVNVYGSSYDDVLAAPIGNSNNPAPVIFPYIDGGSGIDELVVDYSDNNSDLQITSTGSSSGSIDAYSMSTGNYFNNLQYNDIERFNITTGRGNDNIDLGYNNYSDETINAGAGDDYISTGKGYDVVDGGTGFDILNLDFSSNYSGVTSSLNDSNSGEYTSDESVVEFSNIEGVNVYGSSYDDVLAAPIGNSNTTEFIPYIDGGEGFDELIIDLSDRNDNLQIENYSGLNINSPNHSNYLDVYSIESFDITTGRGDDDINLDQFMYSDETIDAGAGDDFISAGRGNDVVDGGRGYDVLNLDFSTALSGVTSSLSDRNSGEYITDDDSVEFSNIEAVSIYGSAYDDVLVAPISTSNSSDLYFLPMINGGEGIDELVVDYSEIRSDLSVYSNGSNLSISVLDTGNFKDIQHFDIEKINLTTGKGNDVVELGYTSHVVDTGAGDDSILFGIDTPRGNSFVDGGSGFDVVNLDYSSLYNNGVTASVTNSGNVLYSTDEGMVEFSNIEIINVFGSDNDDVLIAVGNSNSTLNGGNGNDSLIGSDGDDYLDGYYGDDTIRGGNGDDLIEGSNGADRLFGDGGNDTISGGDGADKINGGNNNDEITGGDGTDTIYGDGGNDLIYGDDDKDSISGNAGNDTMNGGAGNDFIRGGDGEDLLFGGDGKDNLFGDGGMDIFALQSYSQYDVIKDFADNIDMIGLSNGLTFGDLTIVSTSSGTSSVIKDASNGNEILAYVSGVDPADITSADFVNL